MRGVISLILICSLSAAPAVANSLSRYTVITYPSDPYVMEGDNGYHGLLIELIEELFRRGEIDYQIKVMPLKRGMQIARENPYHCVLPVARSQEREADFRWISPVLISRYGLFSRQSVHPRLVTLADAEPYRIGSYRGSIAGEYLEQMGYQVQLTSKDTQNLAKLEKNRIDLWASDLLTARSAAAESGRELYPVLVFYSSLRAMACHKTTNLYQQQWLTQALVSMYQDGFMDALLHRYGVNNAF